LKLVRSWESRVRSRESGVQSLEPTQNFAVDWFESRLNQVKAEIEESYKDFRLSEILKTIYSLIWDDFCSWYLEWIKPAINESIDSNVYTKTVEFFEELMQLLHPFMPFATEEIYHQLKDREEGDDLTIKQQLAIGNIQLEILKLGEVLKNDITSIRDVRNKNNISPKEEIKIEIEAKYPGLYEQVEPILKKQTNAKSINYVVRTQTGSLTVLGYEAKIHITSDKKIDIAAQKQQLKKDLEYFEGFLSSVEKKLTNERFVQNAKPEVIEIERKKKADAEAKIKAIRESLSELG
jgi:valyl-tRNA synthetase